MKLEKIIVKGLFGVFNHEIVLKEHITILVSENGYGKTTILKMLKALFEYNIVFFHTVIFEKFILEFGEQDGLFPESKNIILEKDTDKNIYLNGNLILNNDNYQAEMLITVKNAYDEDIPEDISIIELIQSSEYNRFDRFKQMYNNREIKSNVAALPLPKIRATIINTNRVDGFLSPLRLKDYYTRTRQEGNNEHFIRVINSFLIHKKIVVENDKFVVISNLTHQIIPLVSLSSGEKHLFAIFYELIFRASEGSFVLLDEPEISLHISWQNKFIRTLQEIVAFKPLNILIATHSPNIIDSHWKMVIELNEPIDL